MILKTMLIACGIGIVPFVAMSAATTDVADHTATACQQKINLQPVVINPGEAVLATFLEESLYKPEDWYIHDGSGIGLTMQKAYRMFHGAMSSGSDGQRRDRRSVWNVISTCRLMYTII